MLPTAADETLELMELVKLAPRIVTSRWLPREVLIAAYALNARIEAVHKTINNAMFGQASAINFEVADKDGNAIALDCLLMTALARNNNELYLVEKKYTHDQGQEIFSPFAQGSTYGASSLEPAYHFEHLHASVLDGLPTDLLREVEERLSNFFPNFHYELRDMWGGELSNVHTNRYYLSRNLDTRSKAYFILVPREYAKKSLDIDLAPGVRLSLDSQHYRFDLPDGLVLSSSVFEALELFLEKDVITPAMIEPLVKLLPEAEQAKAAAMQGRPLLEFLTAEVTAHQERINMLLRRLAAPILERNARNNRVNGIRNLRNWSLWRQVRRIAVVFAGIAVVIFVAVKEGVEWLLRNNIAHILFYTVGATLLSQTIGSHTHIIALLWFYACVAIIAVFLRLRTSINFVERLVLLGYPEVYPLGDTPADILSLVPESAVQEAIHRLSRDEPVEFDAIVQSMVIKPSWGRVVAICIGSLEPISYKEWSRQVRQRRSLAYDAVRLAITKAQQIGPQEEDG